LLEQDEAELFAPVQATTRTTLLTTLLTMPFAGLLAYGIARTITKPIQQLTSTAQHLAAGDLSQRVSLRQRDEIGQLGTSFNTMAQSLEERVAAEQQAQAEAQQLRQVEADRRQQLETVVSTYNAFADQVAQGNLTVRVDVVDGQDELTLLGHNLNRMVRGLHTISRDVQQASAAIASAAAEILASTSQQAASATEQSAAITQTTTTVEEVKAIAQQTAHQANQLVSQSHQVLDTAHQGSAAVDHTVDGMGLIRARVESIAHTILALAEQTHAIGEITATVTDLADQSNLLALNAAIEAARAGEQGKGFAVVAQHVRELAERSKSATTQVQQILHEIQRHEYRRDGDRRRHQGGDPRRRTGGAGGAGDHAHGARGRDRGAGEHASSGGSAAANGGHGADRPSDGCDPASDHRNLVINTPSRKGRQGPGQLSPILAGGRGRVPGIAAPNQRCLSWHSVS
jgi:methyl-accepting chemotaxis protein